MAPPPTLKDAPLVLPLTFSASSITLSLSSSLEHYPSPTPPSRPTAAASYGFSSSSSPSSHAESSIAARRRGLVVGCEDGTLWIVPCDEEKRLPAKLEEGVRRGEGEGDGLSSVPLPPLPKITTTGSDLPPLPSTSSKGPLSPPMSPNLRFPRSSLLHSRSSSPKPSSSPHLQTTGRNRVLSTSSMASNHTTTSNGSTPNLLASLPSSSISPALVNKGRIVSGLSATVAAPPTLMTGEETLGERKDELRELLEHSSGGRRGRNGGSLSSLFSGSAASSAGAAASLEDVVQSLHKASSPPSASHQSNPQHPASALSSSRSSFSSSRRASGPIETLSTHISPSEDFVKLPQSPTTLPAGGLPLPASTRHSFSSLRDRDGAGSPRISPSALPFASTSAMRSEVQCSGSKRVVHILPGAGVGLAGGMQALEVIEKRGWVVCLLGSGHVLVFSLSDGLCLSTVQIPSPLGAASSSFLWTSLTVYKTTSTYRAIISGSSTTPSWDTSFTSLDGPALPRSSKLVLLDLDEMEFLPSMLPLPDLPFSISSSQLVPQEDALVLLLSSATTHHLLPFTVTPPAPKSLPPNSTSASSAASPNLNSSSSAPTSPPQEHTSDISAHHVTKAFKDLFRSASSSKPTSGDKTGAEGLVAGGWSVNWGALEELSSTSKAGEGRSRCLSMNLGRWVDWVEGEEGFVEVWELGRDRTGKRERRVLARVELSGLGGVEVGEGGKQLVTRTEDELSVWTLVASDPNGDHLGDEAAFVLHRLEKSHTIDLPPSKSSSTLVFSVPTVEVILVESSSTGLAVSLLPSITSTSLTTLVSLGSSSGSATVVLPAGDDSIDQIYVGDDQGRLSYLSVSSILSPPSDGSSPSSYNADSSSLEGSIACLVRASNSRTGTRHVVGGADDGSVGVWDATSLLLQGRWSMFTSPVTSITMLSDRSAGRLRGCLLCVSAEGTIGFVVLDGLELLYLIPGTRAPLSKIYIGEEESILLIYENEQARLWDLRTQELRRSMLGTQGKELVEKGAWVEVRIDSCLDRTSLDTIAALPQVVSSASTDAALTILLDIRALHALLAPDPKIRPPVVEDPALALEDVASPAPVKTLRPLVPLLSALLTWGLDKEMDARCKESLGLIASRDGGVGVGLRGADGSIAISREDDPFRVWKTSPAHTGFRSLAIVSILQMYLSVDTYEAAASEVISFYAARLQETIGEGFQVATLAFYAEYWLHSSLEIQQAARVLFGSVLAQTPDNEILAIVEACQNDLPSCQPDSRTNSDSAARALVLIGQIAVENHAILPPSLLKDVSTSITFYLHDDTSPYRQLAINLCSSGFQIWQHYVDAMEILRSLFRLATQKTIPTTLGLTAQARHATLQIASSNTPLFMTTLAFDILNASTPAQRNATMKLVAFLAKRRPLVLYASLARIAEAVVKSLDPNVSVLRDAVQLTATVILDSLVSTFPSIDFHGKSQKLAVGTHEGAVILYDLKTATRLFVLEGHKHKITAVSFSPDGRRVVTVSLDESKVVVWKVGLSFNSLFNVGAPPRQGGPKPGDPYKSYDFHIGDEGNMTTAASLEWVRFEWPGERSARLRIRETALTFAT